MPINDKAIGPDDFGGSDFEDFDAPFPHEEAVKLVAAARPAAAQPTPRPQAVERAGDRWACTAAGCNAVWTRNPGQWHTHEVPVPGSKSRKTYVNESIVRVAD